MGMSQTVSPRIACLSCEEDALHSLRILIGMLKPYLACDWHIHEDAAQPAALYLVNLDCPQGPALLDSFGSGVRALGCSLHPRQHPAGTIHYRPFRSYELLSVLKEIERVKYGDGAGTKASARQTLEEDTTRRFKLTYWPDEFEDWPRPWWPILASLRWRRLSVAALADELDLPRHTVAECLDRLLSLHAVTVEYDMQAMMEPRREPGILRKLGERLVGLLRDST